MLFGVLLVGCSKAPKLTPVPPDETLLAFGDSVTYGTGASAGQDWPSLLAAITGWRIVNAGIPGDTAELGKDRIRGLLDQHQPSLVIVEMGGNDFLRRRPQKDVKEDLRSIVRTVKESGAQVVLIGVPQLSLLAIVASRPKDAPIYEELADEERVPLIGKVFSAVLSRPELCSDQIHPNADGYRELASGIDDGLRKAGAL